MTAMQNRDIPKRYIFVAVGLALVAIAAIRVMQSGWHAPGADTKSQIVSSKSWEGKAVQIEHLWSDGRWYPRAPLPLMSGYKIQGHNIGEPDFTVQLEPVYRTATEPNSLYLARAIRAQCADGRTGLSTILHDAATASWEARLDCSEGTWRLRVVDSGTVLRPPHAKPGEMLPLK